MNRSFPLTLGLSTTARRPKFASLLSTLLLALVVIAAPADVANAQSLRRSAIVRAVQQASSSVVNINGHKIVPADDQYATKPTKRVNGMGTGVVIDPRGYILTNYHVVEGVRRINVTTADKRAYVARVIAHDPTTDLAIIKIPTQTRMKVIQVGSSRDIMTGETVIAMGNAYGYEHSVTTGIVSAQHRNVQVNDQQSYRDLIQTDASINPGNSGGPLLNIDGNMIGINVAVRVGAQGIGFAIPVDQGMQVAARLMSIERLSGIWHGVLYEDQVVGDKPAVVVRGVKPGSPAERAGLRQGDVIRQVAGRQVDRGVDLECALIGTQAGESIAFGVERHAKPVDIELGLASRPEKKASRIPLGETVVADPIWVALGMRVDPLTEKQVKARSDRFRGGVMVRSLKRDGLSAKEGIRKGDVLVGIHKWETISTENINYILEDADFGDEEEVAFYVLREGKTLEGRFDVSVLR